MTWLEVTSPLVDAVSQNNINNINAIKMMI